MYWEEVEIYLKIKAYNAKNSWQIYGFFILFY